MAYERNPNDPSRANDPYRANPADDPYRTNPADDELRRAARLDNELQPDPELAEGPAGGGRIAVFAVAVAVVLGAAFYGLNHSSLDQSGMASTAQDTSTAQNTQSSPPAAPPGMRDVTPRASNTEPGMTTGAAPAQPQSPPSSAPAGQDMNRSGNPPMDTTTPNNNPAPNK